MADLLAFSPKPSLVTDELSIESFKDCKDKPLYVD